MKGKFRPARMRRTFFLRLCLLMCLLSLAPGVLADTYYHVHSGAPNDSGVPNGDPAVLENCWQTIHQAYADLKVHTGNDLTGKGKFTIQIENSGTYTEGLQVDGLTTSASDTLTIRAADSQRPTWQNDTSTVLFVPWDGINSYGCLKIMIAYVTVEGINFTGMQEHGVGLWAGNITVRNCIFYNLTYSHNNFNHNSAAIYYLRPGARIYNNTFYNVITAIMLPDYGPNLVRNNIFYMTDCSPTEPEQAFLTVDSFDDSLPDSDYNIFYLGPGTQLAYAWAYLEPAETYAALADWQACYLNPDAHSLTGDPEFVIAGADYHLQSSYGHWTAGGWVMDAQTSPCLDAGEPFAAGLEHTDYSREPLNNGGRVNMGAYANSYQASLSGWTPTPTPTPTRSPTASFTPTPEEGGAETDRFVISRSLIRVSQQETLNISYALSRPGRVQLMLFDLSGRQIGKRIDEVKSSGVHTLIWNCAETGSGTYLLCFSAEGRQVRKKIVIVR